MLSNGEDYIPRGGEVQRRFSRPNRLCRASFKKTTSCEGTLSRTALDLLKRYIEKVLGLPVRIYSSRIITTQKCDHDAILDAILYSKVKNGIMPRRPSMHFSICEIFDPCCFHALPNPSCPLPCVKNYTGVTKVTNSHPPGPLLPRSLPCIARANASSQPKERC